MYVLLRVCKHILKYGSILKKKKNRKENNNNKEKRKDKPNRNKKQHKKICARMQWNFIGMECSFIHLFICCTHRYTHTQTALYIICCCIQ